MWFFFELGEAKQTCGSTAVVRRPSPKFTGGRRGFVVSSAGNRLPKQEAELMVYQLDAAVVGETL